MIGHPIAMGAIEQPAPARLGEYVEPIAAAKAGHQNAAVVAVAQHQAAPTMQRAPAAPRAALAARIAQRGGN
jgi:hypothetical protein